MKAIFISYNQGFGNEIIDILDEHGQKGFTQWIDIQGRGSETGIPHYGDHAWPEQNYAILTFVPDDKAPALMKALHEKDESFKALGLRAFAWTIDQTV